MEGARCHRSWQSARLAHGVGGLPPESQEAVRRGRGRPTQDAAQPPASAGTEPLNSAPTARILTATEIYGLTLFSNSTSFAGEMMPVIRQVKSSESFLE